MPIVRGVHVRNHGRGEIRIIDRKQLVAFGVVHIGKEVLLGIVSIIFDECVHHLRGRVHELTDLHQRSSCQTERFHWVKEADGHKRDIRIELVDAFADFVPVCAELLVCGGECIAERADNLRDAVHLVREKEQLLERLTIVAVVIDHFLNVFRDFRIRIENAGHGKQRGGKDVVRADIQRDQIGLLHRVLDLHSHSLCGFFVERDAEIRAVIRNGGVDEI